MNGFPPSDKCTQCKGACCKYLPSALYPDELKTVTVESLVTLLKTGNYVVDWWEGDPRGDDYDHPDQVLVGYFLRPSVIGGENIKDPSWGGICVFLTRIGCKLDFDSRPLGCRMLEPIDNAKCDDHGFGKNHAARAWLPYHKQIEQAIEELESTA